MVLKKNKKPSKEEVRIVVESICIRVITRSECAELLGIPYSTICDHGSKYTGKASTGNFKPPNLKLLGCHLVELMNHIKEKPDAAISSMCKYLSEKCNIEIIKY
jgi:transposase